MTSAATSANPYDFLTKMEVEFGLKLPGIKAAREHSLKVQGKVEQALSMATPQNCSVVTCGSLARCEMTSDSDIDWIFLVDGSVDPRHRDESHSIFEAIKTVSTELGIKPPNPEGVFGKMCFSHELVHAVGGSRDSNFNTTHRLLLLLESHALFNQEVRRRAITAILNRYLDPECFAYKTGNDHDYFPRFLMNDVVRFWRTMTVDYAAKVIERDREGWALRNTKLRFSRKLIFVTGMLLAYEVALDPPEKLGSEEASFFALVDRLQRLTLLTPLEILSRALLSYRWAGTEQAANNILLSYDQFLAMLDDPNQRDHLKKLQLHKAAEDETFDKVRRMSDRFEDGLNSFFWDGPPAVAKLSRKYTLF
jgi:hypothetical protein